MDDPIRVLRVIARLNVGGPALHAAHLSSELDKRGYETTLVSGRVGEGESSMEYFAEELGPYYERAAVVCVPSRREGYGVVAREAMAYGRPVVATAVGGLVDVAGILVPPGDVARLREVLEQLLADADWRAQLGAGARRTAREQLAPEAAAAALAAAYEEAAR